ncbi:MAG: hypothetical protein AAF673_01730 [Pseudomonadota bacterium]
MVGALKSSTDILRAGFGSARDIGTTASSLKEAQVAVTNPNKFTSRSQLDQSGLARRFDELQGTLLNVKSQDTTANITRSRLGNEQKALEQVNGIMVRFEEEMSQSNNVSGSKQDKVNRALAKLETALRAQDTSGKYVWGGKDATTDPLSRLDAAGNRIPVSLVNESNVVDGADTSGLITNGYSTNSSNSTIVTVSSQHEVRESFLHPGHDAIAKAIGYLNMVKANADAGDAIYTDQQLAAAQREQLDARGALKVEIDTEVKKVEQAFDVNKRDEKDALKENNDLFSANLVERTQQVHNLIVSMAAQISISNVDSKISGILGDLRV